MDDDLKLPPDLQFRMMKVEADHIYRQYEASRTILYLHEQEFVLLWMGLCGTMVLFALCYREVRHLRRELNGSD